MILPPNPCSAYPTDESLYTGLKQNDDRAYACLYAQTFCSFAHYVQATQGTPEHAQDAFQQGIAEFYVAIQTGRYQVSPKARLKNVLFEFCKRKWINELQSAHHRRNQALESFMEPEEEDFVDDLMTLAENVAKVERLLKRLGEGCQQVIQLFYIQGKSLTEIADLLTYTPRTARTKRYECTEQLKRLFWNS
jgi:RNA polymerase sigma factor (sigma-70 family)